ncbi:MAG: hypothetical protein WDM87_05470 [Terracidiphilus sp.]
MTPQLPPPAAKQPKYPSCSDAEKDTSGVYRPALAVGTPGYPFCHAGVAITELTPPPDAATVLVVPFHDSFQPPSGMYVRAVVARDPVEIPQKDVGFNVSLNSVPPTHVV